MLSSTSIQCCSCLEYLPKQETLQASCGDIYCWVCLSTLVELATRDEELFPPKCHNTPLSIDNMTALLSDELIELFHSKEVEFPTPNRTYCSNKSCVIFIRLEFIRNKIACCPDCLSKTCTVCKNAAHDNEDCMEDPDTKIVLDLAKHDNWQRCNNCKRLVSLNMGCNHIT